MKLFHFFSNHKYTGPADPALVLASELHRRSEAVDLTFFAGQDPKGNQPADGVHGRAKATGLPVSDALHLFKHGRPLPMLRDVRRLRRILAREQPDVLHTHLPNDHLVAALASRGSIPLVRTVYDAEAPRGFRARAALARTSAALVFSDAVRDDLLRRAPQCEVVRADPILDLDRFSFERDPAVREEWNVTDDDFVVGVVARMQTHRLFPELIEGFARAAREDEGLRLVCLGRGTNQETVAFEPARRSGVEQQILFPGYIPSDRYPQILPAFDALVFMVPGSDGTCRAAREALACGVPLISTRRGLLPSLNEHNQTGLLLDDETPAAIARALRSLREDRALHARLVEGARSRSRYRFDVRRHVDELLDLYRTLLDRNGG
ncbi:MAG: glycosyltransferase family 4 protein [Planctomycetota bacterium]